MRRSFLAVLLVLSLAGCTDGGSRAPFAESRTPPSLASRFYPPDNWAWGYVRVGDGPAQRYGVAAPPIAPRATIVILTGYGEPAEKWFETVQHLISAGFTVWVLERQGQGGSERLTPWRDLGHVDSFQPDGAALRALVKVVIRPRADRPLLLLGHADGALVALGSVEDGLPTDGLILTSPTFVLKPPPSRTHAFYPWANRLKLGWIRAPNEEGWSRANPDEFQSGLTSDRVRGGVQQAWLTANPDLRMGAPSIGWQAAHDEASRLTISRNGRVKAPVLILSGGENTVTPDALASKTCSALTNCRMVSFPAGRHVLHMESDAVRNAWLAEIDGFIRARIAARAQRHNS